MPTLASKYIERIRELHRMLTHIKANPLLDDRGEPIKFAMESWHSGGGCGTAACACGHMPSWPAFKNEGWKLLPYGGSMLRPSLVTEATDGRPEVYQSSVTFFGSDEVHDRVFTGIYSDEDGKRVVLDDVTIDMVIARVEELLRDHGATP